jgi:hypothetical protein
MNENEQAGQLDPQIAAAHAIQSELSRLGLADLRARWLQQPDLQVLEVGTGQPAEQSITGFPEDAFHGVAVYNPTGHNLRLGFNVKAAIGSVLLVPPGSLMIWPAQYANLSIESETAGPAERIAILRLRYPPAQPALHRVQLTSAIVNEPKDIGVGGASTLLLPANPLRRGLYVASINEPAANVRLGLGVAARIEHGIWIPQHGVWTGQLSGALWLGEVTAISEGGEVKLAVLES